VLSEDDERVVILLHATRRTLYRGLEPCRYAPIVKYMFTLELFIGPLRWLKTNSTRVIEVRSTLAVLDRLLFTLRSVKSHGRAIHYLLGTYKFRYEFSPRTGPHRLLKLYKTM
jgi:hypothetical protein